MSPNQQTVQNYMAAFRQSDHAAVLACLTDDVEWICPGAFHLHGKTEFDGEIENEAFVGRPEIQVTRLIEQHDLVVAEGNVRCRRRDGVEMFLVFCDVFEMQGGKIRKLISYLMDIKDGPRP